MEVMNHNYSMMIEKVNKENNLQVEKEYEADI